MKHQSIIETREIANRGPFPAGTEDLIYEALKYILMRK